MFSRIECRPQPYKSITELPMMDDPCILFATTMQNALQPKNAMRANAVAEGKYKELRTVQDADEFLSGHLHEILTNECRAIENEVQAMFASMASQEDVKMFLEAPTSFLAAACLTMNAVFIGKGDRNTFFNFILESDPTRITDLGKKLYFLTKNKLGPFDVYNDKLCNPEKLNKQTIYRLWLHCVRKHKAVALVDLIKAYPYQEENLKIWDRFVDIEGKTTLNPEEYKQFRLDKAEEAKKNKKKKQGK